MRKIRIRSLISVLAFIFILMCIVNLIVLRVHFNIHLSDLLLIEGDSSIAGDVSAKGDGSVEGDSSVEGDGSAKGDSSIAGDVSTESNYSLSSLPDLGDAEILINEMSLRDKITLAYIVSRIDRDDLKMLSDISRDGITDEEITALLEYAAERLDPADIESLEEIFYRNRHLYSEIQR